MPGGSAWLALLAGAGACWRPAAAPETYVGNIVLSRLEQIDCFMDKPFDQVRPICAPQAGGGARRHCKPARARQDWIGVH